METLQGIFNNRELAIGLWIIIGITFLLFTKPMQQFLKTALKIVFCKKFVIFYIIFIAYLCLVIYILYWIEFWDLKLLKDTILWALFVELPIFTKAIEKADGNHFFSKLIKESLTISVLIEFFVGFWTFSLPTEIIIIPLTLVISILYAFSEHDRNHSLVKRFIKGILTIWGLILFVHAILSIVSAPNVFFCKSTVKTILLPLLLLTLNLPVVYGLALYNMYEQVFIRIQGTKDEQTKMKLQVILFARINLSKISAIRKNLPEIVRCHTSNKLKDTLNKLSRRLDLQIGENYMKRSHYYILACILGIIISLAGLIGVNTEVTLKDLVTLNFVIDIPRFREILTYIFSTSIVFSVSSIIVALGFNKKQKEDISQIKKFALFELLASVKQQNSQLLEYIPIDNPSELFIAYVLNSHQIKVACDKVLTAYENLLTMWELDTIKLLRSSAIILLDDFGITDENASEYTNSLFCNYYNEKVKKAPQNDKINTYTHTTKSNIEKYTNYVKQFYEDFKYYYK